MFKKFIYILLFVLLGFSNEMLSHPLHLTLTNIDIYNDSVKVTIRISSSDFELALADYKKEFSKNNLYAKDIDELDLIKGYIDSHFKLSTQKELVNLNLFKRQNDDDIVWFYLEGQFNSTEKALLIENYLLSNLNGNERNMLIVNCNNEENGYEFTSTDTKKTITLVP